MKKIIVAAIAAVSLSFLPSTGTPSASAEAAPAQIQSETVPLTAPSTYFTTRSYQEWQGYQVYVTVRAHGTLYRGYLNWERYASRLIPPFNYYGNLYRHDLPLPITS